MKNRLANHIIWFNNVCIGNDVFNNECIGKELVDWDEILLKWLNCTHKSAVNTRAQKKKKNSVATNWLMEFTRKYWTSYYYLWILCYRSFISEKFTFINAFTHTLFFLESWLLSIYQHPTEWGCLQTPPPLGEGFCSPHSHCHRVKGLALFPNSEPDSGLIHVTLSLPIHIIYSSPKFLKLPREFFTHMVLRKCYLCTGFSIYNIFIYAPSRFSTRSASETFSMPFKGACRA